MRFLSGSLFASALLLLALAPPALGQAAGEPAALYVGSEQQPVRVTFEGLYQRFGDLAEASLPLRLYVPIGEHVALGLNTSYAAVSGDDVETLSALGDVQIAASYFQPIGTGSLVTSLSFNVTTGSSALSFGEFRAATLASQAAYAFRVPSFGQGLRVAPALTYAFPVGERVALGLGAAYQYRGPYEPLADEPDAYDPGEEVLLTLGADLEVTPTSSVAVDLSLGLNGTDRWGPTDYEPGNTGAATVQFLQVIGPHEVRAFARYRARGKSALPDASFSAQTAVPTHLTVGGEGQVQLSPALRLGALARVRSYSRSALLGEGQTLADLGLAPVLSVSERLHLTGRFVYTLGSFSGVTAGGGLSVAL